MLLKKIISPAESDILAMRGVDLRSASFSYMMLNPLGVTLAPLQSTILQMCLFIFFHTNSSEQCGKAMCDNTPP